MPEPTKEQIEIVFKKLKQNRYNKVSLYTATIINVYQQLSIFFYYKKN